MAWRASCSKGPDQARVSCFPRIQVPLMGERARNEVAMIHICASVDLAGTFGVWRNGIKVHFEFQAVADSLLNAL